MHFCLSACFPPSHNLELKMKSNSVSFKEIILKKQKMQNTWPTQNVKT